MNKCYDDQYRESDTRCVTHDQQLPPTDHLIKNTRKDIGATEQNEKKNTHIYKNSIDFLVKDMHFSFKSFLIAID